MQSKNDLNFKIELEFRKLLTITIIAQNQLS